MMTTTTAVARWRPSVRGPSLNKPTVQGLTSMRLALLCRLWERALAWQHWRGHRAVGWGRPRARHVLRRRRAHPGQQREPVPHLRLRQPHPQGTHGWLHSERRRRDSGRAADDVRRPSPRPRNRRHLRWRRWRRPPGAAAKVRHRPEKSAVGIQERQQAEDRERRELPRHRQLRNARRQHGLGVSVQRRRCEAERELAGQRQRHYR